MWNINKLLIYVKGKWVKLGNTKTTLYIYPKTKKIMGRGDFNHISSPLDGLTLGGPILSPFLTMQDKSILKQASETRKKHPSHI